MVNVIEILGGSRALLVDICGVRALIYKRRIMYIMYSLVLWWGGFGCFGCVFICLFYFFVCLFYLMWFWLIGIRLVAV